MPDADYIVSVVALAIVALLGANIWLTLVMLSRVDRLKIAKGSKESKEQQPKR
jgi:hypothetical protein